MIDFESIMASYRFLEEKYTGIRCCFHGHTHYPLVVARRTGRRKPDVVHAQEEITLERGCTWLINPGSVGQPRDGNPHASFGILDTDGWVYRNLRVAYDVGETQRKIREAGLPPELAWRLAEGR
jgi:diadenosine tetraphosphatase ApaH/serine/threonine PP2A family protein phosphatase